MNWTNDQTLAINERDSDILLSAAAGSGKTTVMVERIFEIVKSGVDVESLLVITFTRAAASDMKRKLVARFFENLDDPKIADALDGVERASICTIDSYCSYVLRQHFEAAGVDPGYRVLDDAEERQLMSQAVDEALSLVMENGDSDVASLFFGREADKLKEIVKSLYAFSRARPDPDEYLTDALLRLPMSDGGVWFQTLFSSAVNRVREALALCRQSTKLCERPDGPNIYLPGAIFDEEYVQSLLKLDYDGLSSALRAFAPSKLKPLRSNADDPDDETRLKLGERVRELRKLTKARLEEAAKMLPDRETALEDTKLNAAALRGLKRLVDEYAKALWMLKSDRMALSFNDVAQLALKALGREEVLSYQQSRFEYVFVDEYQDVSDLQEAIISRVARKGRLFMVGDVKQSIYRFRQAEPSLFIDKYARFAKPDGGGKLISLSSNFRSRGAIIDFVNDVFLSAMNSPTSEIPYSGDALLVRGRDFEGNDPEIELHLIDKKGTDADEAELVAHVVKSLVGAFMYPGSGRKIAPSDIAVIARTRDTLKMCDQALKAAGVKSYVDSSEGYLEAMEVRVMLSLMRAVENRRRDYALLEALRSPMIALTSTQLARIRARFPDGSFADSFNAYMELGDELAGRLREIRSDFDRWRFLSRCLPLPEWIDCLYNETGFYAYAGGLPGGRARQANLDLLCNYASDFTANHPGGLTAFLDYMTKVKTLGGDMSAAHESQDIGDCVVLMTAHKSKGLEFPVVIAAGLGRSISRGRAASELRAHRTLGAGLFLNDETLGTRRDTLCRKAIEAAGDVEALEEEKRVLYVMLTRARERLILTGAVSGREDWEFRRSCPELAQIRPTCYLDMASVFVASENISFYEPGGGETEPECKETADAEVLSEDGVNALKWRYPYEGEAWQPVKLTVTGLAREITGARETMPIIRTPRFLSDANRGAERGTVIHAALGSVDLDSLRGLSGDELISRIDMNLRALVEKGIVPSPVDPRILARFFEGKMGGRLLASEKVMREWQFNLRLPIKEALGRDSEGYIIVQGMIDCCFLESDEWVLIDYKTDALRGDPPEEYVSQIRLYKTALERITKRPVKEAKLCFLGTGTEVSV